MRAILLSGVLITALLLSACTVTVNDRSVTLVRGSGVVTSQGREVSNFSTLSFSGLGDITITQGSTESLTIEAEDNILPQIKTEVRGGQLSIGFTNEKWQDWVSPTKPIKFTLAVKDLSSITSSGLGTIQVSGMKTAKLALKINGAGNIKIDSLDATTVTSGISGAGNIDLTGKAGQTSITMSGLGSYRAGDLACQQATITVSGAGSATVWASESVDATITGAGSVNYYGNPTVKKTISGVGVVKSIGNK